MGLSANGRLRAKAHSGKHGNPSSILGRSNSPNEKARGWQPTMTIYVKLIQIV